MKWSLARAGLVLAAASGCSVSKIGPRPAPPDTVFQAREGSSEGWRSPSLLKAGTPTRFEQIVDWKIAVPLEMEVHRSDGPDFSVTYFVLPRLNSQFGIYEGGHPMSFAKDSEGVMTRRDKVGGQDVTWSVWKETTDGESFMRAEMYFVSKINRIQMPNREITYEDKFHIFLRAPDEMCLATLRDIVRTLSPKEPNKAPEPTPTSVTPPANAR